MGRALAVAIIACIAGCYQSPSLASCKYRCGGANNDSCPNGYTCNAGMCVTNGEGCDGDGGVIDGPPIDDGDDDAMVDMMIDAPPPVCTNPGSFMWVKTSTLDTQGVLAQVVLVDANNDSMIDIAVMDASSTIGVFLGNGDGTFANTRNSSNANGNIKRLLAGDWDHDGNRDDLLTLNQPNTMSLLRSNNDGTFTRTQVNISSNTPVDMANIGDVNGDSYDDLAIYFSATAPRVQVYLQENTAGTYTFNASNMATTIATGTALVSGDVHPDGSPDVFVLTGEMGTQFVMHQGGGSFGFGIQTPINVNMGPVDAVVERVHASGSRSVITANAMANNVSVRRSTGAVTFQDIANPTVGMKPVAVITANIGGNALPDILTANNTDDSVSVLINIDGGSYEAPGNLTVDDDPVDLVSGDFDGDGRLDIAVGSKTAQKVVVYLNKCPP